MAERKILTPSAAHPIHIEPSRERVLVRAGDGVIADTRGALVLMEAAYPAVYYIPRNDVDMSLLARSSHVTYCPYKGDAGYFHLTPLGDKGVDAVWTYEAPYTAVAQIAGYLAFYPDRVTISVES